MIGPETFTYRELVAVIGAPIGRTRLSDWIGEHAAGPRSPYASAPARWRDRVSAHKNL